MAIGLTAGMAWAVNEPVYYNFRATVLPYIMTASTYDINVGNLSGPGFARGGSYARHTPTYANCQFRVTIDGYNDYEEHRPRLARMEVGEHANDFDWLPVIYHFWFYTNGVQRLIWGKWDNQFPFDVDFTECAHDGQVELYFEYVINDRATAGGTAYFPRDHEARIGDGETWYESPDAGDYSCTLVMTYSALL